MAITDTSPPVLDSPVKRRLGIEAYIIIIGVVAVVALGVGRFVYEPSYQAETASDPDRSDNGAHEGLRSARKIDRLRSR